MTAILEDLSRGRIDAAEAGRRIDALSGAAPIRRRSPPIRGPPPPTSAVGWHPTPTWSGRRRPALPTKRPPTTPVPTRGRRQPIARNVPRTLSSASPRPPDRGPRRRAAGWSGSASGWSDVGSVSSARRRWRHCRPRARTCSVATELCLRCPATERSDRASTVSASCAACRAAWRTCAPSAWARNCCCGSTRRIAVDVEVTAGNLHTERVPRLGKVRVTAGGAKLLDVTEVHDVLVQAGSATIKGTITQGRHRVRAESGSLSITLGDESNVTVKSEAQLGRVSWAGGHSGAGDEVVMGHGNARLDVEVVMGHAQVRVGSDATAGTRTGRGVSERTRTPEHHVHRAPGACPVCGAALSVIRLGCGSCGTELAGVFEPCGFCGLDDKETEMLRVFLASRGNLREVEKHLGVSYPTARARFGRAPEQTRPGWDRGAGRGTDPRADPVRGRRRRAESRRSAGPAGRALTTLQPGRAMLRRWWTTPPTDRRVVRCRPPAGPLADQPRRDRPGRSRLSSGRARP